MICTTDARSRNQFPAREQSFATSTSERPHIVHPIKGSTQSSSHVTQTRIRHSSAHLLCYRGAQYFDGLEVTQNDGEEKWFQQLASLVVTDDNRITGLCPTSSGSYIDIRFCICQESRIFLVAKEGIPQITDGGSSSIVYGVVVRATLPLEYGAFAYFIMITVNGPLLWRPIVCCTLPDTTSARPRHSYS